MVETRTPLEVTSNIKSERTLEGFSRKVSPSPTRNITNIEVASDGDFKFTSSVYGRKTIYSNRGRNLIGRRTVIRRVPFRHRSIDIAVTL